MRITLTTLAVLATCVVTLPAQDHRAAMGVWVLNLQQSRFDPGPLPKHQTSTFTQMPDGSVKIENDVIDVQGRTSHREMVSKFDGRPEARAGSAQPTTRAYRWLDDRNFEFEEMIDGQHSVTGRTTVSKDGRVRTLKVDGTRNGKPVHNIEVYELERGASTR